MLMSASRATLLVVASSILTTAALAAEPTTPRDPQSSRDRLEEVIVTATPLRGAAQDSATPTRVLGGDDLIRARASSVGETLADQPGVSATWFGPAASRPVIRGAGGERVQMYQDGGDVLDVSALSNDHAVTLDPLIVDRIEVIRGPATLLFGNSASAGLVNMLTNRIARAAPDRLFAGAVEARGNSGLDERAVSARSEFGTERWRFTADLQRRSTDDVSIPRFGISPALRAQLEAAGELPGEISGRLANSASESRGGGVGISRVGDWGYLGVSFSRFGTEYEIPGPAEEEEDEEAAELAGISRSKLTTLPRAAGKIGDGDGIYIDMGQTRYDVDGEWREPLRGLANLRLRAGWNDYEHREIEPGGELGTTFLQTGREARLAAEHIPLAGWRGTFGVQHRDLDLEAIGAEAFVPASQTRNLGLFLYEEKQFGVWKLEAGARLEQQKIDLPAASTSGYDENAVSASLGTIWQFSDPLQLAVNLTRTERHPTATELFADGPHLAVRRFEIGDATLETEKALTADLALRGQLGGETDGARFSAGVFISDYTDYIFPAITGDIEDGLPVVQYTPTDARFTGLEAEIEWQDIETRAGRVRTRLFADIVRAEDGAGDPLPLIPPLRLGGSAAVSRGGLEVGVTAIWNERQSRLGSGELPTDGFTLLDLDLSFRTTLADRPVLWFVRGTNLLDEDARRHASPLKDYAPLPGRALGAGVRFEF